MRKILAYVLRHHREHYDRKLYLTIALFLAICIAVNYWLNFEDDIIDPFHGKPIKWLWLFLFQAFPFIGVCFILYAFGKCRNWLTDREFWLKLVICMGLLALDRSFYGWDTVFKGIPYSHAYFMIRCLNRLSGFIIIVLPLLLIGHWLEKEDKRYGLQWHKFDYKPYLQLLAIAGVLIGIGSFLSELNQYYPRYLKSGAGAFLNAYPDIPKSFTVIAYELAYGSDFISVEMIFRGFMILAFTRTLGGYAVFPMVAAYAFLHFGKPVSETISSVFGGYVLGVITLYSRNIWGGVLIHLGIAWLMELFGWLHQ